MDQNPKPQTVMDFMLAWMEEPEHKRRIEADDPTITREYDLAMHRYTRDHPSPPSPQQPPKAQAAPDPKAAPRAKSSYQLAREEVEEAERCMGWLSWPEWQKKGEGSLEKLHPVVRDSFIQQYEFYIADIEDGAVDPMQKWGMDKEAAVAYLRKEAAPFVAAQEEFKRNPPKMPPIVEAHYRQLWPWFLAPKADP